MQPAFSTPFPEPLPAAMPQLSEKPRHGVRSWNPAPHPGHFVCNSRTAIGLQFGWSGIVSDTVVAPSNSIASTARCAAANASSFASLLGISNSNWLGQSLLGNDISTISNIAFGSEADQINAIGGAALSNPTPFNAIYQTASAVGASETGGIRLVQTASQDVWGNSQFYAKAISIGETATAKTISKAFAVFSAAKLAYDVGAYAYAYYNCSAGH